MTAVYSILHMLVDGACAIAMFGTFLLKEQGYIYMLLYNFCAFALQMPFGILLDILNTREERKNVGKREWPFFFAMAGIVFTVLGMWSHPVVLGIGNALFHVGGGVGTIREDMQKNRKGKGLGVFVAPGALGLYLGMIFAKKHMEDGRWISMGIMLTAVCLCGYYMRTYFAEKSDTRGQKSEILQESEKIKQSEIIQDNRQTYDGSKMRGSIIMAVCCLCVVIIRSYVGLSAVFSWKSIAVFGFISVLATVSGKMAGGFAAARFGIGNTVTVSLILATVGYLLSASVPIGILTVFLFNMTMPITLYLLVCRLRGMEGFSFGLLTFGLFLGFLPEYLGILNRDCAQAVGCMGSILSLILLLAVIRGGGSYDSISD